MESARDSLQLSLTSKESRHSPSRPIFAFSIQDSPQFYLSVRIIDSAADQDLLPTICFCKSAAIRGYPENPPSLLSLRLLLCSLRLAQQLKQVHTLLSQQARRWVFFPI